MPFVNLPRQRPLHVRVANILRARRLVEDARSHTQFIVEKRTTKRPAGQTRLMSAVEATTNVAIGYSVSFAANLIVLPLFGLPVSASQAAGIGLVFTAIALCRSYIVRRLFARLK